MKFQFHKGTIKTLARMFWRSSLHRYFNSIKVQLKLEIVSFSFVSNQYFNSIKVQLKPKTATLMSLSRLYFNSIKVQLKPILTQTKMSLYTMGFQMQRYKKYFKKMSMSNDIFSAVLRQPAYLWRSQ